MVVLRYVYLLALVVWLGGMIVLGAVAAPTTFQVLQALDPESGRALAGEVFGTMLSRFAYISYAAAAIMLLALMAMRILGPRPHHSFLRGAIILAMLAIAVYIGVVIFGDIAHVQQEAGGLPSRLPLGDVRRVRFDALHQLSERLMMVNVIAALALLGWEAKSE